MKVSLYDNKGKKTAKSVELVPSVFEQEVKMPLINQALYVYMSNQRQANAHTKTRGDVSGGGKKPWKQKGTGRARSGSSRSPIWTGGGVTFGPRNNRNFKKSLPRKMKKSALRAALSHLAQNGRIMVIERFEIGKQNNAKMVDAAFKNLNLEKGALLVQKGVDKLLTKTVNNIKKLAITHVGELNVYDLVKADKVVIFEEALAEMEKFWGMAKSEMKAVKSEVAKKTAPKAEAKKVVTKTVAKVKPAVKAKKTATKAKSVKKTK